MYDFIRFKSAESQHFHTPVLLWLFQPLPIKPPFLNGKKAPFPSLQLYLYKTHSLSSTIVQKYEMISSNDWLWRVTVCTTVVLFLL